MIYANLISLAPLAVLAMTGVIAMMLSPFYRLERLRHLTSAGFVLTLLLIIARYGAEAAPATALLADDGIARFGAMLVVLSGLATLVFLRGNDTAREAPALIALATVGAVAVAAATHAVTLFLGLEITTLAVVVLFAFPLGRDPLEAGYKYFLMAGTAAAALLLGLAFGFASTGEMSLASWSEQGTVLALGMGLLIAALAFKFSLVPFHMWAPDVFTGAPASAAAFVGVVSKAAVAVALVRLAAVGPGEATWALGLSLAGAASAILGNLVAMSQLSLTRMLGYSAIAHSGYMALVLGSGAELTGEAVLFYMAGYAPALIAAMCVAGLLGPDVKLADLKGLVWQRPVAGCVLAVALVSMAGLPPAVGFTGKLYIFSALAEAAAWPQLGAAILGAAIAVFYYARFATQLFSKGDATIAVTPRGDHAVLCLTGALMLGLGLYPEPLIALVQGALLR